MAYLEALLPRLPAGKTRSKRQYRLTQEALTQEVEEAQVVTLTTQTQEEERCYIQAAQAMLFIMWCWQQAQRAAIQRISRGHALQGGGMTNAQSTDHKAQPIATSLQAHHLHTTHTVSTANTALHQDLRTTRPPPCSVASRGHFPGQ